MQIFDQIGLGYKTHRQPDPRIESQIHHQLKDCTSVLNVGAGTGSYEPRDRTVIAVEPSQQMIKQRADTPPCVQGIAEKLPFPDRSFDAALAILTIHHWKNTEVGLRELMRIARKKVVIFTWDSEAMNDFWLTRDYLPQILELDRPRFPRMERLASILGPLEITQMKVPHDCTDGFTAAFWRRPEAYLNLAVQRSISAFAQLDQRLIKTAMDRLAADLNSGAWAQKNKDITARETFDGGYRLVTRTLS